MNSDITTFYVAMERGGVFIFILLITSVLSYTTSKDYSSEENERFNELSIQDDETEVLSNYEVTEIVIDVPNNATLGPIIANYTIARPLNLAATPVPATQTTESVTKTTTNVENKTQKSYISIFHIKAEFDKNGRENNKVNVTDTSGFKDYIIGLRKGIVDGFNSFFARPILFLKNLRHKGYDISNRLPKINSDY
ncbi:uncharacterized protein LOC119834511 [Zerene cesonia]|uniref:uncharacterized protein LOC119834511 n=1 Tax=Zerene cesonia TaxID=33412 RepID=UPI0018E4DD22|nr:uncharacterized protein LOC119834511 [Zerene cesonia]